jgi:hypothetical protein
MKEKRSGIKFLIKTPYINTTALTPAAEGVIVV